jgi:hypothetical protein
MTASACASAPDVCLLRQRNDNDHGVAGIQVQPPFSGEARCVARENNNLRDSKFDNCGNAGLRRRPDSPAGNRCRHTDNTTNTSAGADTNTGKRRTQTSRRREDRRGPFARLPQRKTQMSSGSSQSGAEHRADRQLRGPMGRVRLFAWAFQRPPSGFARGFSHETNRAHAVLFGCTDKTRTVVPVLYQLTHAFLVCSGLNS